MLPQAKELEMLLARAEKQLDHAKSLATTLADENEQLRELLRRGYADGGSGGDALQAEAEQSRRHASALHAAAIGARPARHSLAVARAAAEEPVKSLDGSFGLAIQPLLCPLSGAIMHEPVIALDGWTYERAVLEQYWRSKPLSTGSSSTSSVASIW